MAAGFQELKRKLEQLARSAENMGQYTTKIGVLDGQYDTPAHTPVAYVAAIQEFGCPEVHIPPRPFIRPTVKEHRKDWADRLGEGAKGVLRGDMTAHAAMDAVGELGASQIKLTLSQVQSPPLSPVTVMLRGMKHHDEHLVVTRRTVGEAAKRVAQGETNYGASDKPLEDTFTLLDSISYEVDG